MSRLQPFSVSLSASGFLRSLLRDRSGNALAIVAAAIVPLLAIIGGGIDMGRSYLTESRLQAACDAGVLAARKTLGSTVAAGGVIPAAAGTSAQTFFNINFPNGLYGTQNRTFVPTLEADYAISGVATAEVPTTIMRLFSFTKVPVRVECEAKLNFSNTDLMMVLDTTGSMLATTTLNSVTMTRMAALKSVVRDFYLQMDASRTVGTRIRYGFLPYSNNVNVGGLLQNAWVATTWDYHSRVRVADQTYSGIWAWSQNHRPSVPPQGSTAGWDEISRYVATWNPPTSETGIGYYSCPTPTPPDTGSNSTPVVIVARHEDPVGSGRYVTTYQWVRNTTEYWQTVSGTDCVTYRYTYTNYREDFEYIEEPYTTSYPAYDYKPMTTTFTDWRTQTQGCIEERQTSNAHDFSNFAAIDVNSTYLDLNLDLVPTAGVPATQWKPAHPSVVYLRGIDYYGGGTPSPANILNTTYDYMHPHTTSYMVGATACPAPAMNLTQLDNNVAAIDSYLATLTATGVTYHDIGMIWGGRMISKDGIFATENADVAGKPTNRHLIFLTDGATETLDIAYSAYGIEGLDNRRKPGGLTLNQTVERRFAFACEEVKKRNITVWVIGFGTAVTQLMKDCAGDEHHWFPANDANELAEAFATIGASMGDLRITK